jgi:uncharacterized membrane protein
MTDRGTFDVVLTGDIAGEREHDEVIAAIAGLFKMRRAQVADLLARAPVIIKRGTPRDVAERYQGAVERCGAACTLQAAGAPAPPPAPAEPPVAGPRQDAFQDAPTETALPAVPPIPPEPAASPRAAPTGAEDTSEQLPSAGKVPAGHGWTWVKGGASLFARSPGIWIAVTLVWGLMAVAINFVPVVGFLAFYLLQPVFIGGMMLGCAAQDAGEDLEINHLFAGFSHHTSRLVAVGGMYLAATVAVTLVVVVLMLVLGGGASVFTDLDQLTETGQPTPEQIGMLLSVGAVAMLVGLSLGLILVMAFWFAPLLVILDGVEVFDAILLSLRACLQNWLPLLVYGLVLSVLSVIAMIPLGLGLLILGPVFMGSLYRSYRDIFS